MVHDAEINVQNHLFQSKSRKDRRQTDKSDDNLELAITNIENSIDKINYKSPSGSVWDSDIQQGFNWTKFKL